MDALFDLAAKGTLGVVTTLAFVILAFLRGWIVPGIQYEDLKIDRDYWRSVADRALTAVERVVQPPNRGTT